MFFVKSLQKQDASNMEIGIFLRECLQLIDGIVIDCVGAPDEVYDMSLHSFSRYVLMYLTSWPQ